MAKLNRVCFTCGIKHSYCPSCYEDRHLDAWHVMFHDENCKNIFNIVNQYFYKHITIEEAIVQLEKSNLTKLNTFNEDIEKEISDILAQKKVEIKPTYQTSYEKKKK